MQDLDKFKNEMNLSGKNVYVGHRYVPKVFGEWDNTQIYEPLSIVQYQGASYTSRQYVPVGVELTNEDYWVVTGNYNAQVEQYRQDVRNMENDVSNINDEVTTARNGEANLSDRLESDKQEVNAQLAQIELNPLDFGVTNDGVLTEDALNNLPGGFKYKFPRGTYRVRGHLDNNTHEGFKLKDNTTYEFEEGAVLTLDGNSSTIYSVIQIRSVKNFKLINPQIIGERYAHDYSSGETHERGRGIYITGDSTGVIINPRIKDCSGDGIDIIANAGSDIEIHEGVLENNRRNNLSVESVDRLRVYNTELKNANGIAPETGLDIEPYDKEHILNDVKFYNIYTHSNANNSLMITNLTQNNNIEFIGGRFEDMYFGFNLTTFENNEIVFNQPLIKGHIYNRSSSPKAKFLQPTIVITEDFKSDEAVITFHKVAWSRDEPGYMSFIGMNVLNPHEKEMDLVLFKSKEYAENRQWEHIFIDVDVCELNGGYASDVSSRLFIYNSKLGTIPGVKIPINDGATLQQLNRPTYLLPVGVTITNDLTDLLTQYNVGQFLSTSDLIEPEFTLLNTKYQRPLSVYSSKSLYPKNDDWTDRKSFTSRIAGASITMRRMELNGEKQWVATNIVGNWNQISQT